MEARLKIFLAKSVRIPGLEKPPSPLIALLCTLCFIFLYQHLIALGTDTIVPIVRSATKEKYVRQDDRIFQLLLKSIVYWGANIAD